MTKQQNQTAKSGACRLCGVVGPLSFEHTPPKSAFNSSTVLEMPFNYVLGTNAEPLAYLDDPRGNTNQRGAGGRTLCESCNNWTGSRYASKYVEFCHAVMPFAHRANESDGIAFDVEFSPLNVLKHISLMFLTSNSPDFHTKNPELVDFVSDPNSKIVPKRYRFHMALTSMKDARLSRSSGVSARIDFETSQGFIYSEIAYPPIVNVLSIESPRPDQRLTKVNWFRHYEVDCSASLRLSLFALPIVSPFPGDYRTETELRETVANSESVDS